MKVVFILCNKMLATSVTLPIELLLAAQSLSDANTPHLHKRAKLEVLTASETGAPVKTHTGLTITPDKSVDAINDADILYLPALWRNPLPSVMNSPKTLALIKKLHNQESIIAGVGTGCCFIAQTGILDGKSATTHWYYFDNFEKRYPNVQLKKQVFITQAGRIYCTASVNSLAELTVTFIAKNFNLNIAQYVQRHFFHEIRQTASNENNYSDSFSGHNDEEIMEVQAWLQDNYSQKITMALVAEHFGFSTRTLARRFKKATGLTPVAFLQLTRIDSARDLLKSTNLTVYEIMDKVGYHDATHFNNLFEKLNGVKPGNYRTTVRAKIFNIN